MIPEDSLAALRASVEASDKYVSLEKGIALALIDGYSPPKPEPVKVKGKGD